MNKSFDRALVWLRRDLRADDHAALHHALRSARQVWCVFIFDRDILDALPRADRRVEFIRDSLVGVDAELRALAASHGVAGAGLMVRHGWPAKALPALATELGVQAVYANHDDEPAALARDAAVRGRLADAGIVLHTSKDHLVFERNEVLTMIGGTYSVFTPYKTAWLKKLTPFYLGAYPVERHAAALAELPEAAAAPLPSLESLGFERTNLHALGMAGGSARARALADDFSTRIEHYDETRNFPALKGPSYLSLALRFGTLSIRGLARAAHERVQLGSRGAATWLAELVWRDFYHQILHHHPQVVHAAYKPGFDALRWEHGRHADALFDAWAAGRTGYPLVDAAMAQINQTGYMHNRLRMVVASFLVKDLGIDWRRGEAYFALHLNDYDLAANNGGWQWAARS